MIEVIIFSYLVDLVNLVNKGIFIWYILYKVLFFYFMGYNREFWLGKRYEVVWFMNNYVILVYNLIYNICL